MLPPPPRFLLGAPGCSRSSSGGLAVVDVGSLGAWSSCCSAERVQCPNVPQLLNATSRRSRGIQKRLVELVPADWDTARPALALLLPVSLPIVPSGGKCRGVFGYLLNCGATVLFLPLSLSPSSLRSFPFISSHFISHHLPPSLSRFLSFPVTSFSPSSHLLFCVTVNSLLYHSAPSGPLWLWAFFTTC